MARSHFDKRVEGTVVMLVTDRGRVKPSPPSDRAITRADRLEDHAHAQHALLLNRPITHLWRQATLIDGREREGLQNYRATQRHNYLILE